MIGGPSCTAYLPPLIELKLTHYPESECGGKRRYAEEWPRWRPRGSPPTPPVPSAGWFAACVGYVADSSASVAVAVRSVEVVRVEEPRVVPVEGGDGQQVINGEAARVCEWQLVVDGFPAQVTGRSAVADSCPCCAPATALTSRPARDAHGSR